MNYKLILGLEIHVQLATETGMFCSCKNDPFHAAVNTSVCPVCLGLPGALPVPNKEAISKSQRMAVALGSKLRSPIIFERKNYFYPDLPKAFQITTPHYPIGTGGDYTLLFEPSNGHAERDSANQVQGDNVIRWREIHLEEDTAKSMHKEGKTCIDFNKSGVPLLEMVTEPDFVSVEQAVQFCKEIQWYARYLGVSDADMEKGQMRLEANISLASKHATTLPNYRVELKNINSFTFMKKAIEAEIIRQSEALDQGETLVQETRGYNEDTKQTFSQRSKEEAHDYRYFPEPDIPPIVFSLSELKTIEKSISETPHTIDKKLKVYQLKDQYRAVLVADHQLALFALDALSYAKREGVDPAKVASEIINKSLTPQSMSVQKLVDTIKETQASVVSDESKIKEWVIGVIQANKQVQPKIFEDIANGKLQAVGMLVGWVRKASDNKADPQIARKLILEELGIFE